MHCERATLRQEEQKILRIIRIKGRSPTIIWSGIDLMNGRSIANALAGLFSPHD
jgi:hypothetical protein